MIVPIVAVIVAALAVPGFAQAPPSRLVVEITDATGGAVAGVAIVVTESSTGLVRRITTTAGGRAAFTALPPGTYTLTATLTGFKTEVVRDIRLASGVEATLPLTLAAGPFSEQVVVAADAATLRFGTAAVGHVFNRETIASLPLNDRDILRVATHGAGVSPPAPGSRLSTQGNSGLNITGAREAANSFLLDGLDNNDLFIGRLVMTPSVEAVQEIALLQNTYAAEHGRSAGAHVNMVLRSGTRDWNGSLYDFIRHSALDARNHLQAAGEPRASLTRHLFGGSLGGPVASRSSFLFANVEGLRAREVDHRLAHVPTLAEHDGDFNESGVAIVDPGSGLNFPDNRIPPERISPTARAIMALYPRPNRADAAANLSTSGEDHRRAGQATLKTDHHLGNENLLSVRYGFSRDTRDLPFVARNRNLPGFGLSTLDQGQHMAIGYTAALPARMMTVTRAGVHASRRENLPGRSGFDAFAALGISAPSLPADDLAYPAIDVPGYETIGDDPNLPVVRRTRTVHVTSQLALEGVRHQLKLGADIRTYRSDGYNHLFSRGQLSFSGGLTGHPIGDLLLGLPSLTLIAANDNRQALRTWSFAGFVQDSWRVSPSVTLDAGARYEYQSPPTDADNRMQIFDLEAQALVPVGSPGVPASGIRADRNNVAPRLGVSWDLSGHGTLIVRGGYGLFYDAGTLIENSALYFNPPYFSLQVFAPFERPLDISHPFPVDARFTPPASVNTLDPDFRSAYSQQATVGVERVFREVTLTARYVMSHGENLVRKRNINQPVPGPGPLEPRRPIAGFGDILLIESKASSSYHGLLIGVDRRLFRGVAFHGAYTLSQSMDNASAFLASDGDDNTPQNSRDLDSEWGPSNFDVRHRLVLSGIWQLPAIGRSALWRDWQVSAIFTAQSGQPFTPRLSFDNSNTGNGAGATFGSDRPDLVSGFPPAGVPTYRYAGRTFVIPPPYAFGNARRNSLTGPGYAALDVLVTRRLPIGGSRALELRLEIFNLLNRRNDGLPDSFVDRATFGQSLTTHPPRQVQLAGRFTF